MIGRNSSTLRLTLIAGLCVLLVANESRAQTPAPVTSPPASGQAEPPVNPDEIGSLLPLLVPLPEQKRLAAELRTLLESGDIKGASEKLNIAVEVGALAAILLDWLPYPALLAALKALPDDADVASQPAVAGAGESAAALTEALERERSHSAALSEELSTTKSDFLALKSSREEEAAAATAMTEGLRESVKQQEEHAQAAARDLAAVTQELARVKSQSEKETASAAANSGDLAKALKDQQEQANAKARELADATQKLATLTAEREREQAALAADKASLTDALKSEQDRANSSSRDLQAASKEIETLRAAQASQSTGASTEVANLQQALTREKARSEDATRQTAKLADEMRALQDAKVTPRIGLERSAPTGAAMEMLNAPPPVLATGAITVSPEVERRPDPGAAVPAQTAPAVRSSSTPPSVDDRLTARADTLFRSGDVSGARLLLERAQEGGNAQAIFLLAETFDPNSLATIGAVGIRSDPARARELYGKALALGIARAGARMEALK